MTHDPADAADSAPGHPPYDLDAASSEPLHPRAREVLMAALDAGYADPRRLHQGARTARLLLDNARAAAAEALEVRPDELSFTSSGTDAVHRGLLGLLRPASPAPVVHGAVEHSSVLHAADWAGERISVPVDVRGRVDLAALRLAVAQARPTVVALQSANHEVGTRQPIDETDLPEDVSLFVDACASMGREPLPRAGHVIAGSAHKWGGPAGVGVMIVRKRARWRNPFPADDRVDERVSGFENVPAALAAAAALQAVVSERDELNRTHRSLIDLVRGRMASVPDVEVVGHGEDRLPHLVTFSCLYVDGEALVTELDRRGFGVASGSACTASTLEPSHVLAAMGVLTHGNVRLSLHRGSTREQVEQFCTVLPEVVAELRSRVGL